MKHGDFYMDDAGEICDLLTKLEENYQLDREDYIAIDKIKELLSN